MVKSKERFEEMRANSKRILMETALKLFSSKGYHATSISSIAKEAGVAVGLMYNYFSSKEQLLTNIIDDFFDELVIVITHELDGPTASFDVKKIIDATIKAISQKKESWRLLISIMFQPDVSDVSTKKIHQFFLHQQSLSEQYYIKKGVNNPKKSAEVLDIVLHSSFMLFAASGDIEKIQLLRETVIENLIENGV